MKRYKKKTIWEKEVASVIYLLCYPKRRTQEEMAKIIYRDIRRQSYISIAINDSDMVEGGYLDYKKGTGYLSNYTTLFEKIKEDLKKEKIELEKEEEKILLDFLANDLKSKLSKKSFKRNFQSSLGFLYNLIAEIALINHLVETMAIINNPNKIENDKNTKLTFGEVYNKMQDSVWKKLLHLFPEDIRKAKETHFIISTETIFKLVGEINELKHQNQQLYDQLLWERDGRPMTYE